MWAMSRWCGLKLTPLGLSLCRAFNSIFRHFYSIYIIGKEKTLAQIWSEECLGRKFAERFLTIKKIQANLSFLLFLPFLINLCQIWGKNPSQWLEEVLVEGGVWWEHVSVLLLGSWHSVCIAGTDVGCIVYTLLSRGQLGLNCWLIWGIFCGTEWRCKYIQ